MSLIHSLKNSVTSKLSNKQTKLLRNVIEPPFLYSPLSKDAILILGCQRSGTTLTYLILNSHPLVKGIDETETGYTFPHQSVLYLNLLQNYRTCLKLPNQTAKFEYISQHFPKSKIIIPIRNPYQVVSSMKSFAIEGKAKAGNWLDFFAQDELLSLGCFFPEILSFDLDNMDKVSIGAYIWKYKSILINKYQQAGFDTLIFKYEELLGNSRKIISQMLEFAGLEWDDIVLNHQQYYAGDRKRYPGGTRGDRAINTANKKRQLNLSKTEIELVTSICQPQMSKYDYQTINI